MPRPGRFTRLHVLFLEGLDPCSLGSISAGNFLGETFRDPFSTETITAFEALLFDNVGPPPAPQFQGYLSDSPQGTWILPGRKPATTDGSPCGFEKEGRFYQVDGIGNQLLDVGPSPEQVGPIPPETDFSDFLGRHT